MRVKNITFPPYFEDFKKINFSPYFEDIMDFENDRIDVFVKVEDGYTYIVTLATAKHIESLINEDFYNETKNYFRPGYPYIIVKQLTQEIIKETIEAYAKYNDGYWLKLYHFEGQIDETVFNQLQAEHILDEATKEDEENDV